MKCINCGAELYDDARKCPFCKETLVQGTVSRIDGENSDFDMTYNTTTDQVDVIRNTVEEDAKLKRRKKRHKRRKGARKNSVRSNRRKRKIAKNIIRFIYAVILVIAVILCIRGCAGSGKEVNPLVYSKGNFLYMDYDGKSVLLSKKLVIDNSGTQVIETNNDAVENLIKNKKIVVTSEDGTRMFFLDRFDLTKNNGVLSYVENGKIKRAKLVSEGVNDSFVVTKDGKSVLFLTNANVSGEMGTLYFWSEGDKEPVKIAGDIDKGTYKFSDDGKEILFIQNYNRGAHAGDLYTVSVKKLDEKIKLDTDVHAIWGKTNDNKKYIYSQSYNSSYFTYDLYITDGTNKTKLFANAKHNPKILENSDRIVVLGANDDNSTNLYIINIKTAQSEKIAAQVNNIEFITEDEKRILYRKVFDNNISDYYVYTEGGTEVKIADSVTTVNNGGISKFDYSQDLSKFVYIKKYDDVKKGGELYLVKNKKGDVKETKLADDVYSCRILSKSKLIYAKDFSNNRKVADLYAYDDGEIIQLRNEIKPDSFSVNQEKGIAYVIGSYINEKRTGKLFSYNDKLEETVVSENVNSIKMRDNKQLSFITLTDAKRSIYLVDKKNNPQLLDEDITDVFLY